MVKPQSRSWSLVESITNTVTSYIIAVIIGYFVYKAFEVPIDLWTNMKVTACFTLASIIRGYLIRRWFNRMGSPRPQKPVEYEPIELSDLQIQKAMRLLHEELLGDWRNLPKQKIQAVKCDVKFPGYGFVEGRTSGWVVNDQLTIVEGDFDYDSSEVCVIVNNQATMLLECRYEGSRSAFVTRLTIISPEMDRAHGIRGQELRTIDDWRALPVPVKKVLIDLLAALLTRSGA